jgi:hypothetical protein
VLVVPTLLPVFPVDGVVGVAVVLPVVPVEAMFETLERARSTPRGRDPRSG